jgi:hypothetical protein
VRFILCLLITSSFYLTAATSTARAATYYVDPDNGSDTAAGTSWAAAWKTIDRADPPNLSSGDTVILKDGYYGDFIVTPTNHTDWITYEANDINNPPIFRKVESITARQGYNGYLAFDGLKFPFLVGGNSVGVRYCFRLEDISYINISNCYIEGDIETDGINTSFGIRISADNADFVTNITIDNCTITNLRFGIQLDTVGDPDGAEGSGAVISD